MTPTREAVGPLTGIRVLDLTSVLMGPSATRTLGDFGADVITVEPQGGDRNRAMGPGPTDDLSGVALNLMRNKRSVMIDLKTSTGRDAFLAIAATADVMITNLRPGPLHRLELDYDNVRAVRSDIIFCAAHGYPSDSDKANAPAYDDIIQSASGFGDLFQRMGAEPALLPTLVADKVCGMAIVNAVLAALFHRANGGEGQYVEIPMIDVMRAFVLTEHGSGAIPEPSIGPAGYPRILTSQRKPQPTTDGWINVLPYDGTHYNALFAAGDRSDLIDDERFSTRRSRTMNSDTLYREVASVLATRTTAEWLEFCEEHDIPATEAATLDDLVAELPIATHPTAGGYRVIPPPERFSATPPSVRRPAPLIGEHTHEVLAEVGYTEADLAQLVGEGAIDA